MTRKELCVGLNMISGLGYSRYITLLETFGTPDNVRRAERCRLENVKGIGRVLAERIVEFDWDAELAREFAIAARGNVRIITIDEPDYPEELRVLFDPPLCLYIRGKLPGNFDRWISIVGSRRVSRYGVAMTESFAAGAVAGNYGVISGLAAGVDTIAHRAVVNNGGVTIGVLGSGLMHMYPKENIQLAKDIVNSGGAVISEFPLDYPISRHNFPRRNRIVATLSKAVVVVEAGLDSGALITAGLASDFGRDVFAVPGRADNPQAKGCHRLIREGAFLAESFDDVLMTLESGLHPIERASMTNISDCDTLDPEEKFIYSLLWESEADLEELQEKSGMDSGTLLAILMKMEMKLLVERDAGQYYRVVIKKDDFR